MCVAQCQVLKSIKKFTLCIGVQLLLAILPQSHANGQSTKEGPGLSLLYLSLLPQIYSDLEALLRAVRVNITFKLFPALSKKLVSRCVSSHDSHVLEVLSLCALVGASTPHALSFLIFCVQANRTSLAASIMRSL